MKRVLGVLFLVVLFSSEISGQIQSKMVTGFYGSALYSVMEHVDIQENKLSFISFHLKDSRYELLDEHFSIIFHEKSEVMDFFNELNEIYNSDIYDISTDVFGYKVYYYKLLGKRTLRVYNKDSGAYSDMTKTSFNRIYKKLKNLGYDK